MGKKTGRKAMAKLTNKLTSKLNAEKARRRRAEKTVRQLTQKVEVLTTRLTRHREAAAAVRQQPSPPTPGSVQRHDATPARPVSRAALYRQATAAGIRGRSRMTRDELAAALG